MLSAFKHFAHLGNIWPDPEEAGGSGPPPLLSYLLQEDGIGKIILEDGSGFLAVES